MIKNRISIVRPLFGLYKVLVDMIYVGVFGTGGNPDKDGESSTQSDYGGRGEQSKSLDDGRRREDEPKKDLSNDKDGTGKKSKKSRTNSSGEETDGGKKRKSRKSKSKEKPNSKTEGGERDDVIQSI